MENEKLVIRIQKGELDQMAALYEQNRGLIYRVVRKYAGLEDLEDLMQQAYFGLHHAALKFRPELGTVFSTYAVYWIRESIRSYLKRCGRKETVSVRLQARYYQYEQLRRFFLQTRGREPFREEVKNCLGLTEQQMKDLDAHRDGYLISLEAKTEENGGDWLASDIDPYQEIVDRLDARKLHQQLAAELDHVLDERQKEALRCRFLQGFTLAETAKRMGIPESRVRTLQDKAVRRLKKQPGIRRCAAEFGVL